ncbi:hypothetical protein [Streptomyces sp. cmx-4-9]|uniref:hypothetical protein n=1 Tax=Streptomyces sp. cmx-4-9 TaxID=2790941 RepID=UPI003981324B
MTLTEGQRVRLAADTRLTEAITVAVAAGEDAAPVSAVAGSLSLAAGTEGTVVRVAEEQEVSPEAEEYERLSSLLDAFGRDMPPGSRRQLEEKIRSLEPAWTAHRERGPQVRVRVRFDNGFILDDVLAEVFTSA